MQDKSKILIVDDEPDIVSYLELVLQELGYVTVSARNGAEALERVTADPPDLVLLDLVMPVMDGFTVCRKLKEGEATRLIPVIIMTALDGIDDRVKAIELGADEVLAKPVNHRELVARLKTALSRKHDVDRRVSELGRVRDHFAKFVPDAVKQLVLANPDALALAKQERDVSVLFVDISGYSRLTERLAPATLNALVERYFSSFLDGVKRAGGDINETAGDGFMAIFQDDDMTAHAMRAVDTALMLMAVTDALNQGELENPLAIHVGVNSGPALVGSTRFEGRRGIRWTFTASGLVTALAARLAAAAGEGEVLIGPETVARLGGRYRLERVGQERLKNLSEPIEIHRVIGPSSRR
ncbi:MAG TPA: response regulator [Methylomirabilota bacterium]|nr:response regulator [Methylomirabilota bacterium]